LRQAFQYSFADCVLKIHSLRAQKNGVRSKTLRWFHFDPQQVLGPISIFLAAAVAAYLEAASEVRRSLIWVSFGQRDPVFEQDVLILVEFVVLAKHNPKVPTLVAHTVSPPCMLFTPNWADARKARFGGVL
jgi:hypothetical protein